jgi:DNA repair protein RecO (recombination protein O)
MLIRAPAILCASRPHGEHGAVIRLLTAEHGLVAAYLPGARGRQLRPLLVPGNLLDAEVRARSDTQLPTARIELVESRGPWLGEPLAAAGLDWACTLAAASLPEGHPNPAIHSALAATLDAICHAPSARGWALVLARYEALLLREMGYGLSEGGDFAAADWPDLLERMRRQGLAIESRLLAERRRDVMGTRAILLDRLKRMSGDGEK